MGDSRPIVRVEREGSRLSDTVPSREEIEATAALQRDTVAQLARHKRELFQRMFTATTGGSHA